MSTNSTNCTPGSITLTNVSTSTNFGFGNQATLSVSNIISNAVVTVTTNYPSAPQYNTSWTSNLPPTGVSNWWSVIGPGTYTTNGTGLSASFTPTNGGTGTNTFYVSYTTWTNSPQPAVTNVFTNSLSVGFNVIQISNVCEATYPTNQSRTNLGVGELVDLSLVGSPGGTFAWTFGKSSFW